MNKLCGFPTGVRRAVLALSAAAALSACSEAGAPMAPEVEPRSASQDALLTGSYVTRQTVDLADGARVHLVEVHFGSAPAEPVYLAQVGIGAGSAARLEMEQRTYRHVAGSIEFSALIERGTLRDGGRWLDADVVVNGERIRVTLARQ